MKKKIVIIAICAIIGIGLALPLGAQTVYGSVGDLASNTNVATAGLFTNDVDDYMSYHDYSGVLSDDTKWFGFVSGKTTAGGVLDIGYARKFGGIYFGTWFRGNMFRTSDGIPHETKTIDPTYNDALELLTEREDITSYSDVYYESANNFEFLIGVANMGIKVGFYESVATNKNEGSSVRSVSVRDWLDGRKFYDNAVDEYTRTVSILRPYLGWGSSFNVGGMKLSPYADVSFEINGDKLIDNYSSYTEVNGVKQDVVTTIGEGSNSGDMIPAAKIGAWLDLPKKGAAQMTVGLSYGFEMLLVSNDAAGFGSADGYISWSDGKINNVTEYTDKTVTETNMTFYVSEPTSMAHTITPSFKITGEPAENFKLGFMAEVPVTIASWSYNSYQKQIQKTTTAYKWDKPGNVWEREEVTYYRKYEGSTLGIDLNLYLGASYQLIPDRFGINAGIAASPVRYTHIVTKTIPHSVYNVVTEKTTEDDKSVTQNDKSVTMANDDDVVEVSNDFDQYRAQLRGGFTFNFTPKAMLDLAVSGGNFGSNTFNLNISNVNVIFTFKF